MKRKTSIAIILTAVLLFVLSSIAFAENPGAAAAQAMPTETPVPLVTPVYSGATNMNGTSSSGCPMMSGMTGMGTMPGMGTTTGMGAMPGTNGMNMQGMGNMAGMGGMNMQGMGTMGNMSNMGDNYVVLSDPSTWFNINPWILLGWIVVFLVLLSLLAGFILGVFFFARRIALSRPVTKS